MADSSSENVFGRVGLVGRREHAGSADTLLRLRELLRTRGVAVLADQHAGGIISLPAGQQHPIAELPEHCELIIVVGGDGSMLNVAKHCVQRQIPVIGVNRGRLGFLTDILPGELEAGIAAVLAGDYAEDQRFMLDLFKREGEGEEALGMALNDVVMHPGSAGKMIGFELFVNGSFVYGLEADGLIVATPTGSTAYALSAGGPIMHPGLNAIVLVPMNPHSLSGRPIVVSGDSEIRLAVARKTRRNPLLSCDGEVQFKAAVGDEFLVRKKPLAFRLLHPREHSFYESCRSKLGWGNRLTRVDM